MVHKQNILKVPFADNSLYHAPESLPDEALVMLSDILATGYEIGVLKVKLNQVVRLR